MGMSSKPDVMSSRGSLAILGTLFFALIALYAYSGSLSETSPIIPSAARNPVVIAGLDRICRLQSQMYASDPTQEPETFFEVLGIDYLSPPFNTQGDWLKVTKTAHTQAQDLILAKWSEKRLHLSRESERGPEIYLREQYLDRVASALTWRQEATVYMSFVMPKIAGKRGEARLDALKVLCEKTWEEHQSG
ncbi:hypothetical protein G7046_g7987 [Stylonectria norvegica]|nr:hypothetical protein G7046_g7987 [Stylonectria norvegica]